MVVLRDQEAADVDVSADFESESSDVVKLYRDHVTISAILTPLLLLLCVFYE